MAKANGKSKRKGVKKKATKSIRRKQCTVEKCRRGRVDGSRQCVLHQGVEEPTKVVKKLDEIDRLRFLEIDTALHNFNLEIRALGQEQQLAQLDFDQRRLGRKQRIAQLKASISVRMQEQAQMLTTLGDRYDFDPKRASIDDTTGVIQEHLLS